MDNICPKCNKPARLVNWPAGDWFPEGRTTIRCNPCLLIKLDKRDKSHNHEWPCLWKDIAERIKNEEFNK